MSTDTASWHGSLDVSQLLPDGSQLAPTSVIEANEHCLRMETAWIASSHALREAREAFKLAERRDRDNDAASIAEGSESLPKARLAVAAATTVAESQRRYEAADQARTESRRAFLAACYESLPEWLPDQEEAIEAQRQRCRDAISFVASELDQLIVAASILDSLRHVREHDEQVNFGRTIPAGRQAQRERAAQDLDHAMRNFSSMQNASISRDEAHLIAALGLVVDPVERTRVPIDTSFKR